MSRPRSPNPRPRSRNSTVAKVVEQPTGGARAFTAGKPGEWYGTWTPGGTSINSDIAASLPDLRAKSVDLYQNHPIATRIIDELVLAIAGDGIRPRAMVLKPNGDPDEDANSLIDSTWDVFAEQCCEEGFYAGQIGTIRSALVTGDGLCRFRRRRPEDGLHVPLALQWMEGHFLDETRDAQTGTNGGPIVQGVEFDAIDRKVGLWLFLSHPGNQFPYSPARIDRSQFVSAASVAHLFLTARTGQVRGFPHLANAILALKDLADTTEAAIHREFLSACIGGIIHGMPGGDTEYKRFLAAGVDASRIVDANGFPIERIQDGMFVQLPEGATMEPFNAAASEGYKPLHDNILRGVAAGQHVPYFRATGDLTGYNFSSARIDDVPFWAYARHIREVFVNVRLNRRAWSAFCEAAVLAGRFPGKYIDPRLGYVPHKWSSPRREDADRKTQIEAFRDSIRFGEQSPSDAHEAIGSDFREYLREAARDFKALRDAGIVLDSNPADTTLAGGPRDTMAPAAKADAAPAPDPEPETKPAARRRS